MPDDINNDPRSRFRTILSGNGGDSPLSRLPRATEQQTSQTPTTASPLAGTQATAGQTKPAPDSPFKGMKFGPPFWTIASVLSLTVNVILFVILIVLWQMLGTLQGTAGVVGSGLLGGLYTNFEKMDRAHIRTEIPISSEIPVKFDIQINQQTEVVLSQDVNITGALVTLQTGGLNINRAPTNIVLPAGTRLPINLSLTVPVDQMVPVNMTVPVDIALNQTDLHEPFVGLQEVVRPFYCLVEPNALGVTQQPVCR